MNKGVFMKKFIYWIRKTIRKDKGCNGWCCGCQWYEVCRHDGWEACLWAV